MSTIRTTPQYRRLMALIGTALGGNRADRLCAASSLLKKEVRSFTNLDEDDILTLIDHFESWEKIQKIRFNTGILTLESMMVIDMMIDQEIEELSPTSHLSTLQSRKGYMTMAHVTQDDIRQKYANRDFANFKDSIKQATAKLDDTLITTPEANHGRWNIDKVIPAPSLGLGLDMGTGGIPRSKIIHLYGAKHSGKSQAAFQIGRMSQEQGIPVVLIDTEAALDSDFAENLGMDVSDENNLFQHIMPGNIEELSNLLIELSAYPYTVIVDSIAATASKVELTRDRSKKEARVGGNAKNWADTLAVIRTRLYENGGTLILINQVRANMNAGMFGDPEKPWGSEAIQHQVDLSFKVTAASEQKPALKDRGYKISRFHMKKNRFDDMTDVKIDLPFKPGYPYNGCIDMARYCGKTIGSGSRVTYGEMANNAILSDKFSEDGEKLVNKKGRYVVRIDPLMMSAIRYDEDDFEDVDIEPLEGWTPPEDGNYYRVDIPDVDEDKSEYYSIPGLHESSMISWLAEHPEAMAVLEQRLLNGLNHKRSIIDAENSEGIESGAIRRRKGKKTQDDEVDE